VYPDLCDVVSWSGLKFVCVYVGLCAIRRAATRAWCSSRPYILPVVVCTNILSQCLRRFIPLPLGVAGMTLVKTFMDDIFVAHTQASHESRLVFIKQQLQRLAAARLGMLERIEKGVRRGARAG
jgi:hypothetical protein